MLHYCHSVTSLGVSHQRRDLVMLNLSSHHFVTWLSLPSSMQIAAPSVGCHPCPHFPPFQIVPTGGTPQSSTGWPSRQCVRMAWVLRKLEHSMVFPRAPYGIACLPQSNPHPPKQGRHPTPYDDTLLLVTPPAAKIPRTTSVDNALLSRPPWPSMGRVPPPRRKSSRRMPETQGECDNSHLWFIYGLADRWVPVENVLSSTLVCTLIFAFFSALLQLFLAFYNPSELSSIVFDGLQEALLQNKCPQKSPCVL